jgi:hypothetical protein
MPGPITTPGRYAFTAGSSAAGLLGAPIPRPLPVPRTPQSITSPPAVIVWTGEGGTNGTGITTGNSGGASGDAFDGVSLGSGATAVYDNAHSRGGLAAKLATGGTAADCALTYSTRLGSRTKAYFRAYFYIPSNPGTNHRLIDAFDSGSGQLCFALYLTTAGKLQSVDNGGGQIQIMTASVPLNAWFRVEMMVIGSATAGQVEVKRFDTPDGTVADETITSAATQNTRGSFNNYRFGAAGDPMPASRTIWVDDLGISTGGYLGPTFAATLIAQDVNTTSTPSGNVATIACTSTTAGNLLALTIHIQSSSVTVSSVTDNLGGTWTQAVPLLTSGSDTEIWYRPNIPAGITSVSATMTTGTSYDASVVQVAGLATAGPVRATNTAATAASPNNTGSVAAIAGDFLLGGISSNSATARTQMVPFNALTTGTLPASFTGSQGYLIPTADGTFDAQWSTSSAANTGGVIVAFKNAAAAGASTLTIDGVAASTSSATGDVTATLALSGTAASVSTGTGALTMTMVFAGSAASTSAATGALTRVTPIAGAAASTSAATGALVLIGALAGVASSTSSASGALTRVSPIAGVAASTSSATGDVTITSGPATLSIAGTAASTSSATGAVTNRGTLTGASASTSAATGALTQRMAIAGTASSVSAATGALTLRASISGVAASTSSASGLLGVRQLITGTASSISAALGDLSIVGPVAPITLRPFTGTTARPSTGTTSRPGSGTTARTGSGITVRPFTGTTSRP